MRDRLGKAVMWNLPLRNPTQSTFVRFIRQPQSGLPDMLADYKRGWEEMKASAIKDRVGEK